VVYRIPTDPRQDEEKINYEFGGVALKELNINKLGKKKRSLVDIAILCSHSDYFHFFLGIIKSRYPDMESLDCNKKYECDFVEIGDPSSEYYICCPCIGEHLEEVRVLGIFDRKITIKKVGPDQYSFKLNLEVR